MAPATMFGYVVLRNRRRFQCQAWRLHTLAALLSLLGWSTSACAAAAADLAGLEDPNQPILLADAGSRFRDPPRPLERYESQFSESDLTASQSSIPLPEFSSVMNLFTPSEVVVVELPPEDFRELDEYFPELTTASLDADEQRSVVGGRLLLKTPLEQRGMVHAEARLLWLCEFLQAPEANATAFFSPGDSAIYVVQGLSYGSNWAILGGRFRWELVGGLSAFAGYDTQSNSQQMFHIGSTGLDFAW